MKKLITDTLLTIEFNFDKRLEYLENSHNYLKNLGFSDNEILKFYEIIENDELKEQILIENPELGEKYPVMHTQEYPVNKKSLLLLEELYG